MFYNKASFMDVFVAFRSGDSDYRNVKLSGVPFSSSSVMVR
mgnify:FL=1|jgi:hypothetical protein